MKNGNVGTAGDSRRWTLHRLRKAEQTVEGLPDFILFGKAHSAAIVMTLAGCVGVVTLRPIGSTDAWFPRGLAIALLLLVISKPIVYVGVYDEPWTTSLPLALCRINEFLCIYMLFRRSYQTFEIAYFLSIGSISALLMPDLPVGFPDPRFVLFFLSHSLSLLAVLYAIVGFGFRPTLQSLKRVLVFLGVYTLVIAGVNLLLDSNYLFLRQKPAGASILDYLGPWPVYLIALILLAIVLCFLCYLPFAARGGKHRRQS